MQSSSQVDVQVEQSALLRQPPSPAASQLHDIITHITYDISHSTYHIRHITQHAYEH